MTENLFFFLDETGIFNKSSERFFMLGALITPKPQTLYLPTQRLRDKNCFYDEIKWKTLSDKKSSLIKKLLDLFSEDKMSSFACIVLDRERLDYQKYFKNILEDL